MSYIYNIMRCYTLNISYMCSYRKLWDMTYFRIRNYYVAAKFQLSKLHKVYTKINVISWASAFLICANLITSNEI